MGLRKVYLGLGYLSFPLGVRGIALPLLPTTPFILLAAWCFARSNPELANRLYAHPRFGAAIVDWRDQGAISPRAKAVAVSALAVSYAIAVWLTGGRYLSFILAVIMGSVALFILTRPSPRPPAAHVQDAGSRQDAAQPGSE